VIARAVSGRLRDRTEDERRAVTLYIASLMKPKGSENPPPKPYTCLTAVYIRDGSSDVLAQAEDYKRMIAEP
jgi:hypothetical protein